VRACSVAGIGVRDVLWFPVMRGVHGIKWSEGNATVLCCSGAVRAGGVKPMRLILPDRCSARLQVLAIDDVHRY
jgi:hypothetical protein